MATILKIETIEKIYKNVGLKLLKNGLPEIAIFRSSNRIANSFDDSLYVVRFDLKTNKWDAPLKFKCTADPGLTQLQHPTFKEAQSHGTAIVCEHQTVPFGWGKIGQGAARHDCLLMKQPILLYRDNNRDDKLDHVNKELNPNAGICIHCFDRFGKRIYVNNSSAGCCDIESRNDYDGVFLPYMKIYLPANATTPASWYDETDIAIALK